MTPVSARVTAWVEEASTRIERAYDEVVRLCQGGRWTMRVPVDEARDSDTVLAAALTDAGKLLAVVRGVAELAEELEGWRDNAERYSNAVDVGSAVYERSMGRARAYERAIEGLTALLADAAPDTEKETGK